VIDVVPTTGLEETGIVRWQKQKAKVRFVQKVKLGLKELLMFIQVPMLTLLHPNIAKIQITQKNLRELRNPPVDL